MTRLILVRHGESLWNVEHRYQGQQDSGLTDRGRAQAEQIGRLLSTDHGTAEAIWSSDLPRVLDTATPYGTVAGLPVQRDRRLREVDIGDWAGQTFADVAAADADTVGRVAAGADLRRGGGETFAEVRDRVTDCLQTIADRHSGLVVVFAHGGSIRIAAGYAAGAPSPGHLGLDSPTNCSRSIIELEGNARRLVAYNIPAPPIS